MDDCWDVCVQCIMVPSKTSDSKTSQTRVDLGSFNLQSHSLTICLFLLKMFFVGTLDSSTLRTSLGPGQEGLVHLHLPPQEGQDAKGMCLLGTLTTSPSYRLNPSSLAGPLPWVQTPKEETRPQFMHAAAQGLAKRYLFVRRLRCGGCDQNLCLRPRQLRTLMVWCEKAIGWKKLGNQSLAVGHNVLASISEESDHSIIQTWPSKSLWIQPMKTRGCNYFISHLWAWFITYTSVYELLKLGVSHLSTSCVSFPGSPSNISPTLPQTHPPHHFPNSVSDPPSPSTPKLLDENSRNTSLASFSWE